jgi:hypothetical protein
VGLGVGEGERLLDKRTHKDQGINGNISIGLGINGTGMGFDTICIEGWRLHI